MTAVVVRRPTSTISTLNLGLFGAAVSAHANTADNNDLTYIRLFDPSVGAWNCILGFTTATISGVQYISRMRLRFRIAYDNPGIPSIPIVANWDAVILNSSNQQLAKPDHYSAVAFGTQDPFDIAGAWKQPSDAHLRAWASGDLVNTRIKVSGFTNNNNFFPRIMAVYLDHEVRTFPTTTVTAPTGTITTTDKPPTVFAYDSVDGALPTGYQVKVFSAAQYGAGGFDADTSTPVWNSGLITPVGFVLPDSVPPTIPLPNSTTYKSYVQTRNAATYSTVQIPKSLWVASPAYTLNVNPAAVPTITATANTPRVQNDLVIRGTQNMLDYDAASFEIGVGGWASDLNASVARDTTKFADGVASLKVTATAGGDARVAGPFDLVTVGKTYSARAQVCAGGTTRTARVDIRWYTAAFAFISSSNGTGVAEAGTTFPGTTVSVVSATAPATAAFARVAVTFIGCAASEVHFIDKPSLKPLADVTWTRGGLADAEYLTVWRSIAGGAYEIIIENALVSINTQELLYSDGGVPNGLAATYEAMSTSYDPLTPTEPISSTITAPTSPITLTSTEWWLRDIQTPDDSIMVSVDLESLRLIEHEEMAEYSIIGRKNSVIVRDVIKGITGPMKFDFLTKAALDAFMALRGKQKTLLLKSPLAIGQQWYIAIRVDVQEEFFPSAPDLYCTASFEIVEQDVPTV